MQTWWVERGIYPDRDFETLEPGTKEYYGPYDSYPAALEQWSAAARAKIDICCHRLRIYGANKALTN